MHKLVLEHLSRYLSTPLTHGFNGACWSPPGGAGSPQLFSNPGHRYPQQPLCGVAVCRGTHRSTHHPDLFLRA